MHKIHIVAQKSFLVIRAEKMVVTAASVRQQLANLAYCGGSHKDQAEK